MIIYFHNMLREAISTTYLWACELCVGPGHALVQPLQGKEGWVVGLLQEHVT